MNKAYLLWVPITLVFNFITCWISVRYNQTSFLKGYAAMVACCLIPTWAIASYFSRNLILDNMIYSLVIIVSSPLIMLYLGQGKAFTVANYVGMAITMLGLYLIKS